MKNALMMLLIATMGMFATNSNAEIEAQIEAHNCLEFVEGKYGDLDMLHNLCDRPITVRYCYKGAHVGDLFRCGKGKSSYSHYYQLNASSVAAYGKIVILDPITENKHYDHLVYAACFGRMIFIDDSSGDGRYSCR